MDFERLMKVGVELGLTDQQLLEFIEKREEKEREREEKEREREDRALEREAKRQLQIVEIESKTKLELADKEIELARARNHDASMMDSSNDPHHSHGSKARAPKLPSFDEAKDNLDAYLQRFERFAESQGWSQDEWAINLSALLTGKALYVYSRLPSEQALEYKTLKEALLKRFLLTEEGFRLKFRNSKPEVGENASQFVARMENYLMRWLALGKVAHTFEGLVDVLIREQFISACGAELSLFLKERTPDTASEMAKLAEQFMEARGGSFGTTAAPNRKMSQQTRSLTQFQEPSQQRIGRTGDDRKCFYCGKPGHLIGNCRNRQADMAKTGTMPHYGNRKGERIQGYGSNYNGQGHIRDQRNIPGKFNKNFNTSALCIAKGHQLHQCCTDDSKVTLECGHQLPVMSAACREEERILVRGMPVAEGFIGTQKVTVLRDSGCSSVVVRSCLVSKNQLTDREQHCVLIDGTVRRVPVANIDVDTPYYTGSVEALCMEKPVYDLILGNIPGIRDPSTPDLRWHQNYAKQEVTMTQAVETRAQEEKRKIHFRSLRVTNSIGTITTEELIKAQAEDTTLQTVKEMATKGDEKVARHGNESRFFIHKDLIYREFCSPKVEHGEIFRQLVVPKQFRQQVMKLAHESLLGGHLGAKKTSEKMLTHFYWPGLLGDVTRYCQSCDVCQRTFPKGKVMKVPLGEMPLIEVPFQRVAVDLIGPIHPVTDKGNRYILTIVDYATRYPEAVALPRIEAERVAKALVDVYSRVGVPSEVLTDMGSQFTSEVMREVNRLLSVRPLTTTPYHPACNGLVERFNGTIKLMLRRMCSECPKDWDRYLNALLFAYRESPQESLGFSPFELLYGRTVRGPMAIPKELWTKEVETPEIRTTYQYVIDLKTRLAETCEFARKELSKSKARYKHFYDKKTRNRQMEIGDKALILLPTDHNKLLMQWKGPYDITEKIGSMDYKLSVNGKIKIYHANLLKKYKERNTETDSNPQMGCGLIMQACAAVIDDAHEADDEDANGYIRRSEELIELAPPGSEETISDVHVCEELTTEQTVQVKRILSEFFDVLTDAPGRTNLETHIINTTTDEPCRSRPYPLPYACREAVRSEVKKMMEMGVIEPSESSYASPIVLIKKKDGSTRFCVDYRKLNRVTLFDAEPMPCPEDIFATLSKSKYFSKFDLCKGYWQIPMDPESKEKTAFVTPEGHYQFNVMPFGLVNAPASFSRMMRKLLNDMPNVENYIDDVLVYTATWEHHASLVTELFQRLRENTLTARPSKCFIGYPTVEFWGHIVSENHLKPRPEKLESIKSAARPETKKQLRSFLGLVGYYRKFIPNFAAIAVPLTDLTRKGHPNKIHWGSPQERAFNSLKESLMTKPILRLPELGKKFILQTDASDVGIGAVLLQEHDGDKFPVAYISKKLLERECAYSVIERECLALVWAIQKFQAYLYGQEFMLETDHQPLIYLNKAKVSNGRIMRWALSLQPYRFQIIAIKGKDNVGADYLSRNLET